jgi:hypothetical protein
MLLVLYIPVSHQRLHIPTIKITPHDSHAFPITPIQLPTFLRNRQLLRRMRLRPRFYDRNNVLPVNVTSLYASCIRPAVGTWMSHVGPEDILVVCGDGYAIRSAA